jgi:hypothetical protein
LAAIVALIAALTILDLSMGGGKRSRWPESIPGRDWTPIPGGEFGLPRWLGWPGPGGGGNYTKKVLLLVAALVLAIFGGEIRAGMLTQFQYPATTCPQSSTVSHARTNC